MKRSARQIPFSRPAALAVALLAVYSAGVGCGSGTETDRDEGEPATAQRIICMAPNISETVFALAAGDRVVGVSRYSRYPSAAAALPKVGSFYDVNLEKLVALKPDLLIVQQKHARVEALCRERGIRVLKVHMTRIPSILAGIRTIGAELGVAPRAEALCQRISRNSTPCARSAPAGPDRRSLSAWTATRTP